MTNIQAQRLYFFLLLVYSPTVDYVSLIEGALVASGLSAAEASRRATGNPYFLYGVLRKGHVPSVKNLEALCRVLDLEFYVGPPRGEADVGRSPVSLPAPEGSTQETAPPPPWAQELQASVDDVRTLLRTLPAPKSDPDRDSVHPDDRADWDETRHVEVRELSAAAGGGAVVDQEEVIGRVAFRRTWLAKHAVDPTQAVVIAVGGESMEPTLPDGCSILVDRRRTRRRAGHIYVLRTDDSLIVKRAGKEGERWLLISDHPSWDPAPWPRSATIIGEVRWMARTLE